MASVRKTERLSARAVESLKADGRYPDGRGLMLYIRDGRKSWVLRMQHNGRRRDMGLGPYPEVTLAMAREKALAERRAVLEGRDTIAERRRASGIPTFSEAVAAYVAKEAPAWRGGVDGITAFQFPRMFDRFAASINGRRVSDLTEADMRAVLAPVWADKPETGRKLMTRLRAIMTFARASGWLERPIEWDAVKQTLPRMDRETSHHRAMEAETLPDFVQWLAAKETVAARALLFTILTAVRSGEARGAQWEEIDFDAGLWRVPAGRMKANRAHEVPLSPAALELLRRAYDSRVTNGLVFPSPRTGRALSDVALSKLLPEAGHDVTVHGFRSTFRQWAADIAHAPREVAEACLAHAPEGGVVERAYLRDGLTKRRRALMEAWAAYCTSPAPAGSNVTPIRVSAGKTG